MNVTYRRAGVSDAAAVDRVFRASFIDTFAHLYRPEDLEAFLAKFSLHAWELELGDERFILLGRSERQRVLMVVHSYISSDSHIRIISARNATTNETKQYEEHLP